MKWPALPRLSLPLPTRSAGCVLGLDIGADAARVAAVDGSGVQWVEEISLAALQGFTDFDAVASRLEPLATDGRLAGLPVASSPPWDSARLTVEEFPALDAERFAQASRLWFQRADNLGMGDPVRHAVAQPPRPAGPGEDTLKVDGLMHMVDRVMLQGLDELVGGLGLHTRWLFAQPLCYLELLPEDEREQLDALLLEVGSGHTRMYVVLGGSIRLVRRLKPGSRDIVKALVDGGEVSWEQAIRLLQAHAGVASALATVEGGQLEELGPKIDEGMQEIVRTLASEVERSAAYVRSRAGVTPERVVVTGGLAGSPTFLEMLSAAVDGPVGALDPFGRSPWQGGGELAPAEAQRFALAVGSARLARRGAAERNLWPAFSGERQETRHPLVAKAADPRVRTAAAAGLATLLVGGLELQQAREFSRAHARVEQHESRLEELFEQSRALEVDPELLELAGEVESLTSIYLSRPAWGQWLARVAGCLPAGAWLQSVRLEPGTGGAPAPGDLSDALAGDGAAAEGDDPGAGPGQMELAGACRDAELVGRFLLALEAAGLVERLELMEVEEVPAQPSAGIERHFRFRLGGALAGARPAASELAALGAER